MNALGVTANPMTDAPNVIVTPPVSKTPPSPYFRFREITSRDLLKDCYALRYQVYCEERQLLQGDDYSGQEEIDQFDAHSKHFGAYNLDDDIIGTVRLVCHSEQGYPLHEHCTVSMEPDQMPEDPTKLAEISRLAVSKKYRRRAGDGLYGMGSNVDGIVKIERRQRPEIVLGLYKAMYQHSKRNGITHWYAAMEKTLVRLLWRFGFLFVPIGPEIDYYGPVTPYLADISEVERLAYSKNPKVFWEFMDGLEQEFLPEFARSR